MERILGVQSKGQDQLAKQRRAVLDQREADRRRRQRRREEGPDDVEEDLEDDAPLAPVAKVVRMSKVDARANPPRMPSGEPGLDEVLGGGWTKASLYALYGPPGCGKGRLMRLAAALACKHGHVIFASTSDEEDADLVAGHFATATHAGTPYNQLPGARSRLHAIPDANYAEDVCAAVRKLGAVFVVVDSVSSQKVRDPETPRIAHRQQRAALRLYARSARETGATYVVIAHLGDDGRMSGGRYLEHLAKGGVLRVDPMRKRRLRSGHAEPLPDGALFEGLLQLGNRKNRFGAPAKTLYTTEAHGVEPSPEILKPPKDAEEQPSESTKSPVPRRSPGPPVPSPRAKGQTARPQAFRKRR